MKKEKILCNIENLIDIDNYKKIGINNFLFAVDGFSIGYNSFNINELKKLECNKYLLLNRVLNNEDIDNLLKIKEQLKYFDGIIFEDIGVYNILYDTNITLIWNQNHFATNYKSINYYLEMMDSAVISNELTKEEVKDIIDRVNKPIILNVFGKNMIMYSRRTLLTNFNKYYNLLEIRDSIIEEPITNNEFNIKEYDKGTIIYNNKYFNIINYLNELNDDNILFYLIYPNGLDYVEIDKIINNNSNIVYDDGFMNRKTIYKLGEKK